MPQEIVYPPGCRPVTDNLGPDELIRRLKILIHKLKGMGQDEGMYKQYIPLALHVAKDSFLLHPSLEVQLLIACCIADVLRIYAPNAPYEDPQQVKTVFLFFIKKLGGLRDPKDQMHIYKYYFYLLESLADVKSFNVCFGHEDCQEIFCALFSVMFNVLKNSYSSKVKFLMLKIVCPLITESDEISNKLLDIILLNIVEPHDSRRTAYEFAKDLIIKCSATLQPYIQAFFNQVLMHGKKTEGIRICSQVYNLIYELNKICPSLLLAVLPQLECKLASSREQERLEPVGLLARMFSEKGSILEKHYPSLWRAFLGRFRDINPQIRIKCVQYSMHFLLNHPKFRNDITECLKLRQHDVDDNVRFEVVMAIVSTAKRDFEVVSESGDLLECLKGRTCDKKFKIRKEAMSGLAMIYRRLLQSDVPQATKKAVAWVKDIILHGYYVTEMEDRLLVERLLYNSLVPYTLAPDKRMKELYHLWGTIDDQAMKAFIELQKHQIYLRKIVSEWLELLKRLVTDELAKEIDMKLALISRYLPEPFISQGYLAKFTINLFEDQNLFLAMEAILRPDIPCSDCAEIINLILKKLGRPTMKNVYYTTIKMLLGRISSVMIDHLALKELIGCVEVCLQGGNLIDELGLHPNTAVEKGLKLLVIFSYMFSNHFLHEDIISKLMSFLDSEDERVAPHVLSIFTFAGRYKQIGVLFPDIATQLVPICKRFAETGTPKQAKQAIRCLVVNMPNLQDSVFGEILEKIEENLNSNSQHYRTAIVVVGHIAFNLPDKYRIHIKNIIYRNIVKELLVYGSKLPPIGQPHDMDWCSEDNLPDETRCKVEGLKTMARWLLGLKSDIVSAQKTFRMLDAFITQKIEVFQDEKMSKAELAWLRLTAGCAMLKISEQKGVGDQFSPEQFCHLSHLLLDEVPQVREMFLNKLHKGLNRGVPNKCLPLDFMGFYALTGLWTDKRMKAMACQYMLSDITKRRDYAKTLINLPNGCSQPELVQQLPNIMPDYMLVFAMPVLTHCPTFTSHTDKVQLAEMKSCLTHILEPLIKRNDTNRFGFYKEVIELMKIHRLTTDNDDNNINVKMRTLCDLAMTVLMDKTVDFELRNVLTEPKIPAMYFNRVQAGKRALSVNNNNYLPPDMQQKKYKC